MYQQVKPSNKGELSQDRYAKNREEQQKKVNDNKKKVKDDILKRHEEVIMQNSMVENEKIESVKKKDKKYQKRYEARERKRIRTQKMNVIKKICLTLYALNLITNYKKLCKKS